MRIVVEASQDHGIEIPRTFRLNVDRIDMVEVLDQWYGPDYRYAKSRAATVPFTFSASTKADPSGTSPCSRVRELRLSAQPCGQPRKTSESGPLRVGDVIHIRGHTTDFSQRVESLGGLIRRASHDETRITRR